MLNRVAITDGTYQAWKEATYGIRSATLPESPIFCGGMQSEIAFDEIVSTQQQTTNHWEHLPGEELQPCTNPEEA